MLDSFPTQLNNKQLGDGQKISAYYIHYHRREPIRQAFRYAES